LPSREGRRGRRKKKRELAFGVSLGPCRKKKGGGDKDCLSNLSLSWEEGRRGGKEKKRGGPQ